MEPSGILYNLICKVNSSYSEDYDYSRAFKILKTACKKLEKDHPRLDEIISKSEFYVNKFSEDKRPFAALIKHTRTSDQRGGSLMDGLLYFVCGCQVVGYLLEIIHSEVVTAEADGRRYAPAERLLDFLTTILGSLTGRGWFVLFFRATISAIGQAYFFHYPTPPIGVNRLLRATLPSRLIPDDRFYKFTLIMMLILVLTASHYAIEEYSPMFLRYFVADNGLFHELFPFVLPSLMGLVDPVGPIRPAGGVRFMPLINWELFREIFRDLGDICYAISDGIPFSHPPGVQQTAPPSISQLIGVAGRNFLRISRDSLVEGVVSVGDIGTDLIRTMVSLCYSAIATVFANLLTQQQHQHQQGGGKPRSRSRSRSASRALMHTKRTHKLNGKIQKMLKNSIRGIVSDLQYLAKCSLRTLDYRDLNLLPLEDVTGTYPKTRISRAIPVKVGGGKKNQKSKLQTPKK